jgi:hypothetical protein
MMLRPAPIPDPSFQAREAKQPISRNEVFFEVSSRRRRAPTRLLTCRVYARAERASRTSQASSALSRWLILGLKMAVKVLPEHFERVGPPSGDRSDVFGETSV